ncbi:hypothetical protein [Borreliella tanukii]|uniref:hypothetical protein n=1 Tax=Borreliella tanukii TaxID=56146 RepID=UPI0026474A2A|nr:hypothetical protein [Borreliella tanukii]WKC79395.1 hypothetical protein QIA28_00345 [Borreliella tanukii]WKC82141.1 hypothetical protein QIA26_00325 [Borreliella tanukii]
MGSRFFYIYLFSALIFLFSCSIFLGVGDKKSSEVEDKEKRSSKLTNEQRSEIIKTIKSKLGSDDSQKIARVDEYFKKFDDSKRDVVLQVFSIGFKYIEAKEAEKESANKSALESDFKSKLKEFNYTQEEFNKLIDEFNNFVDPKTTK